jgi:hypothetical protein
VSALLVLALVSPSAGVAAGGGVATIVGIRAGDDWRLPAQVRPAPNTGFYLENASPRDGVVARSFDLTWRQIEPQPGVFDTERKGSAQGMSLASFRKQNAKPGPFWLRLFASATTWAPTWLSQQCSYRTVGPDDDKQRHVPIWDPCVWRRVKAAWRALLIGQNLRNDPRLVMVYVPGAFTWVEFDYGMIDLGARQGLTLGVFKSWHRQMVSDLVSIMNGENDDPSDDQAHKLVYTGEDYPFNDHFGDGVAFLARDAVAAGMGIRNGITEVFNSHLGEAPAYGSHIGADGHLHTDETWVGLDGRRVIAAENECYTSCGLHSKDPRYAVKLSNLKALQLRVNWLYTDPKASYGGSPMRSHYHWVRLELGRKAVDAPDAWAALRDAEDHYWKVRGNRKWRGFPYVRNLERWLVQRDVTPDGIPRRGTAVHTGDPHPDNGRSYESLRTNVARHRTRIYLAVDDAFLGADEASPVELKVTYRDRARTRWRALFRGHGGRTLGTPVVRGSRRGRGSFQTVTFRIRAPGFDNGLPGATDIALEAVHGDLEASFVRVLKSQH